LLVLLINRFYSIRSWIGLETFAVYNVDLTNCKDSKFGRKCSVVTYLCGVVDMSMVTTMADAFISKLVN